MMGYGCGMGWIWLIWPLGIASIVLVAVLLLRGGANTRNHGGGPGLRPGSAPSRTRAQEILDERFARGDITDQEYQEHLRVLGEDPGR
jgi:putative membrane protein